MTLLVLYAGLAVAFSFLCSLLEASFLSARVVTLLERRDRGDAGAQRLLQLKQERIDDALSSILILNTVANTAGATLAGAQAKAIFAELWVGIFTGGLILTILVGSEIVPKTLGAVYANRMVKFTAVTISGLMWSLTWILPLLPLTRLLTRLLARRDKQSISRGELAAMVNLATREGILPADDLRVVTNVLRFREIRVGDVMTPRTVAAMLPAATTIADFLAERHEDARVFSRIPLFENDRDDAASYVLQREVLGAAARGAAPSTPLGRFRRKALFLPEGQTVDRALRTLTERREHLALVTDEYGGISGLISLEDLMETILGIEIVDESDRVEDLRKEATRLRDLRLAEIERWRTSMAAEVEEADPETSPGPPAG